MWVIGYGSLMCKKQFQAQDYLLVTIKGWKRIFNKDATRSSWKHHITDNNSAALNVMKSNEHQMNAIALKVDEDTFLSLFEREHEYHIERVKTFDFKTGEFVGHHLMFVAHDRHQNVMPIGAYFDTCRNAAYQCGDEFGKAYDDTTFLWDDSPITKIL